MKRLLPIAALLTGCGADGPGSDVPVGVWPEPGSPDASPVVLTARDMGALEAVSVGRVTRSGRCLQFGDSPGSPVIVWEEGTERVADGDGWAVRLPGGDLVREGDRVQGAGGSLPTARPIADFTAQDVPEECSTQSAMLIHSIDEILSPPPVDPTLPPPPPPPPQPSFLEQVRANDHRGTGRWSVVRGIDDPRDAMFAHVIAQVEADTTRQRRALCLRQATAATLERMKARFADLHSAPSCRWEDGGVFLRADDRPGALIDARIECDGIDCVAEGAVTYGNVGGEGQGYVLERSGENWRVRAIGLSWMS